MTFVLLVLAVVFLAYSNGANDNFKGVATVYGSGAANYRVSLAWATIWTILGSATSLVLAAVLVKAFGGKGIIPDPLISPAFLVAVGGAGAATVLLATVVGMPTSTTHALTGALVGAAWMAAGTDAVNWTNLGTRFFTPLLISPVLALVAAAALYPLLTGLRRAMGIGRQTCLCVGQQARRILSLGDGVAVLAATGSEPSTTVTVGETDRCIELYQGRVVGIDAQSAVHWVHFASAGAVCFARSVNDTPKIAALLLTATALGGSGGTGPWGALALVAAAMAIGGLLQSRKVAETMSCRITDLSGGQGLTANLVTAGLVLGASQGGMPVSTTHVSCGSIFGIGVAGGRLQWGTVGRIGLTWLLTLPTGALLAAALYALLISLGI